MRELTKAEIQTIYLSLLHLGVIHWTKSSKRMQLAMQYVVAREDLAGMPVHHTDTLEGFCRMEHPELAVLCIPRDAAHSMAERLVQLGIRAFWNFSQADLLLSDPDIMIENVFLGDSLSLLAYGLNQPPAEDAD